MIINVLGVRARKITTAECFCIEVKPFTIGGLSIMIRGEKMNV